MPACNLFRSPDTYIGSIGLHVQYLFIFSSTEAGGKGSFSPRLPLCSRRLIAALFHQLIRACSLRTVREVQMGHLSERVEGQRTHSLREERLCERLFE